MAYDRRNRHPASAYGEGIGAVAVALRFIVVISCIAALIAIVYGSFQGGVPHADRPAAAFAENPTLISPPRSTPPPPSPTRAAGSPTAAPAPREDPTLPPPPPTPATPRIGIVAGHWENDTGAVCPDGLQEVTINLDVARRVVNTLTDLGYQADLLSEYDARLEGYQADALVSIHSDSCEFFPDATPPASGFKVASVEDSMVPEIEERLVACLAQCYAARTGMYFHASSITYDMIYYHNFYEIDDQTPGAIIEIGFMRNDRDMLTKRSHLVAQGIVDGIVCFLKGEVH